MDRPRTPREEVFSRLPLRRVEADPEYAPGGESPWPAGIPAVAQLLRDGLDLGPATVFVGENGTGKSTVVEALAMLFGLNPEGGSTGARNRTYETESPLAGWLRAVRSAGAARWGYFLRAETMHGFFTYNEETIAELPRRPPDNPFFHEMSHGESFTALLGSGRFARPGFYVFDEPESALSFTAQLTLLARLHALAATGRSQIVLSTHSPVLAALPGATIYELDDTGMTARPWEDLAIVDHQRRFLQAPDRYLRHLLGPT